MESILCTDQTLLKKKQLIFGILHTPMYEPDVAK
jgi:hypothetical protein